MTGKPVNIPYLVDEYLSTVEVNTIDLHQSLHIIVIYRMLRDETLNVSDFTLDHIQFT